MLGRFWLTLLALKGNNNKTKQTKATPILQILAPTTQEEGLMGFLQGSLERRVVKKEKRRQLRCSCHSQGQEAQPPLGNCS
jgi:uncharacterized membrane protein affecting hemolysin expression